MQDPGPIRRERLKQLVWRNGHVLKDVSGRPTRTFYSPARPGFRKPTYVRHKGQVFLFRPTGLQQPVHPLPKKSPRRYT